MQILDQNESLQDLFFREMKEENKVTSETSVDSMQAFLKNVLKKNFRCKSEQEALLTLFQATSYMSDNFDYVAKIIGFSSEYINQHEVDDNSSFQVLLMKRRNPSQCSSL